VENAPESCLDIAEAVRTHRRTALEAVDAALVQAERRQATFRAFITLAPELARRQAERVDQRVAAGERLPLAGVPFAVKDLFDAAGLPTTCGSKAFEDRIAERDATVVRRLVEAGAVLLGKANMHECAFGFTGENPHYGDCKNPVDPQRVAGGSSSGSAVAVALGICPFAIGSDTGGSIRLPAALCGLVGLKPTYGRLSRAGGVPLAWSMDHVGPLTRSAADAAAVLQVIAGPDPKDDTASRRPTRDYRGELEQSIQGLRLGVPRDSWFFGSLDPAVASAVENAIGKLEALGAKRIEVSLPLLDEALGAHRAIIFAEASAYYRPFLRPDGPPFGDDIRPLLQAGLFLPAVDYLHAQRVRRKIRDAWTQVFAGIDCLLTPTTPLPAVKFGQQTAPLPGGERPLVRAYLDMTLPFNLVGFPAVSVPCGVSPTGLPIGLQVVGRPFAEATILRVARRCEQA
jgi:aspartyl-tRNA(Asn)/glutamyl-tRNA(Gln) amidotransferase subunit A